MKKAINGFELESISNTVEAIQANKDIAKFQFRARNRWISGGHNRSTMQDFYGGCQEDESRETAFVFDNGEPPILLGSNEGANPVEFVLHALAGCMTTTMMLHAAANGISVDKVSSKLVGDLDVQGFLGLDKTIRNGYQNIKVEFDIQGDLTEEERQTLIGFAHQSPVFDIVTNGVPVQLSAKEVNEGELA
ncbi:OsmC family protein [Hyunsoonleella sp. SJ7]|uniref:OsmC family protein n=1 Tax=Hyunsoonleella aquatilis TaxID=2762758 RepID=A0A923HFD0_9FLAO|nr:OsmC family protein [Hyunsoonleella aquatilis]MBC3757427.1 OsmC family protein [Hyunsoonleella aquatilis]